MTAVFRGFWRCITINRPSRYNHYHRNFFLLSTFANGPTWPTFQSICSCFCNGNIVFVFDGICRFIPAQACTTASPPVFPQQKRTEEKYEDAWPAVWSALIKPFWAPSVSPLSSSSHFSKRVSRRVGNMAAYIRVKRRAIHFEPRRAFI